MMAYQQQRAHQFRSRIDFDDPSTTKPQSLAKSAVLQALEEEEREQSRAGKGLKRVAWPPPAEFGDDYQHQQPVQQQPVQQPYQQPYQQPAQHPSYPQQQQQQYQQPQQQPRERIIPIQRPEPSTQQPQYQPQPTQAFQPLVPHQQQQQQQQQLYQQPEVIPQHYQQQPPVAAAADSQLPFITTLRKEAPMSQEPTPVYHTEPVAAIYQGGTNMRGDQKWPPADVKKQSDLENEERLKLAQQPAFRPRKVQKDYSEFFAKNALNATYPGYRAPPGTQHHS